MLKDWHEWWKEQNITLPQKYPRIIFEGCDASGKTTIQEIMKEIIRHAFIIHTSAPTKGNSKEYFSSLLEKLIEFIDIINQPLFIDRFHIGELVYGSVFRPETIDEAVEKKLYDMEKDLLRQDVKILYVTASPETIVKRIQNRGDWYVKVSDVEAILNGYEKALAKSRLPIFRLDTTNNYSLEDIKNLILFAYGI
jgi:thymidylate kinase